ncbi:MAG: exopolysaccharide biosynthesis protein, partial [Planctomycetaceae bacterium]
MDCPSGSRAQSYARRCGATDRADGNPREQKKLHSVREVLDVLDDAADGREYLSLGEALDAIGHHSFAPLLLLPGLIMALPGPADIPGVPVVLGALVIIIAVQMILKRKHVWVPSWIKKRQLSSRSVKKMIDWCRRPAGWMDRL